MTEPAPPRYGALRHVIGQQASVWPLQLGRWPMCRSPAEIRRARDGIPVRHWLIQATTNGAKITETMLINLIRMLRLGPEVSLNGSPTVSPMTAAL